MASFQGNLAAVIANHLTFTQIAIATVVRHQLIMGSHFTDAALIQHHNLVGVGDGREPVRDHDLRGGS